MLKSHESGLVRAADLFHRVRWIEDPRGTRKSFSHDPRDLKIPVRRREHHSLDVIPHSALYRSRYDGRVRAICLTEGLAKTSSRFWDTSDSSDIVSVERESTLCFFLFLKSDSYIARVIFNFILFLYF